MDITISIPSDMQDKLRQRAMDSGQDVTEHVEKLIERDLSPPGSLRDTYAPVRQQIKESGVSDDELDTLLEDAREEAYQEMGGESRPASVASNDQGKSCLL